MKKPYLLIAILTALTTACGGGGDSSESVGLASSTVSNNPLGLSPAPLFSHTDMSVTYDDCFPAHDDVVVGDTATDWIEDYDSSLNTISAYTNTATVSSVSPFQFNGRAGVSVVTDSPPRILPNNSLKLGTEATTALLRGAMLDTLVKNYLNDGAGVRATLTTTPLSLGDIASGNTVIPYHLGDSATNTASFTNELAGAPELDTQGTLTETITFIGVEAGTRVQAGRFDYSCVFRHEVTGVIDGQSVTMVSDRYTHRLSGLKSVTYNPAAPRPLIAELVSSTALDRRIAAPQ